MRKQIVLLMLVALVAASSYALSEAATQEPAQDMSELIADIESGKFLYEDPAKESKAILLATLIISQVELGTSRQECVQKLQMQGFEFVEEYGELGGIDYIYDVVGLRLSENICVILCCEYEDDDQLISHTLLEIATPWKDDLRSIIALEIDHSRPFLFVVDTK